MPSLLAPAFDKLEFGGECCGFIYKAVSLAPGESTALQLTA
jgi:hypothetical protein